MNPAFALTPPNLPSALLPPEGEEPELGEGGRDTAISNSSCSVSPRARHGTERSTEFLSPRTSPCEEGAATTPASRWELRPEGVSDLPRTTQPPRWALGRAVWLCL